MTQEISRRKLVTGTAWAAPAVLASVTTPALAASNADDGPCLDSIESYAIHKRDRRKVSTDWQSSNKYYEEVTVPAYARYLRFVIAGGSGGTAHTGQWWSNSYRPPWWSPGPEDFSDYSGGKGGGGSIVEGIVKVKPGQIIKLHAGAGGIAYYDKPAIGGEGYSNGGDSSVLPESVIAPEDREKRNNPVYNHVVIYSGSGGGSSALLLSDPADPSKESLIAVAGGGGGSGARGMASLPYNPQDEDYADTSRYKKPAVWATDDGKRRSYNRQNTKPPLAADGGYTSNVNKAVDGEDGMEVYELNPSATVTVHSGKTAESNNTSGGAGAPVGELVSARGLAFSSTPDMHIRTSNVPGVQGEGGEKGRGADGVAAYGYAFSTTDHATSQRNVSGYIVSGGGGGGYSGGGSGGAIVVGAQTFDPDQHQYYDVSAGATAGGGGGGGNYVASDVIDVSIYTESSRTNRGWRTNGYIEYSFCPSDSEIIWGEEVLT